MSRVGFRAVCSYTFTGIHHRDAQVSPDDWEPSVSEPGGPLISQRAAIVLLLGALTALGAGALTVVAGGTPAGAVLTGGAAFAASVLFFNTIIG